MTTPSSNSGLPQIDAITIFAMIREMNDGLMSQAKATNNNVAAILRTDMALQENIKNLITSLTDTRDKRYQEEIDELEQQLSAVMHMLEEKKAAKQDNQSTSERIKEAAKTAVTEVQETERKRKSIDWLDVRNTMVKAGAGATAVAIIYFLARNAPAIGEFIQRIFGD